MMIRNAREASPLHRLLAVERRRQRIRLLTAGLSASGVAGSAVLLLGLSGWFITAASLAGAAGAAAATAFNTLLPSAAIRLLAILRTGGRYAERMAGHDAALRALARIRPALFAALANGRPEHAFGLSTGEAVGRLVEDVDEVEQHFVRRTAPWSTAAASVTGAALMTLAGGIPLAVALLLFVTAMLTTARALAIRLEARSRSVPQASGLLREEFAILAAATPELGAYGLESWALDRIDTRAAALVAAQARVTAGGGWFSLLLAVGSGLAGMLALSLAREAPLPLAALAALGAVTMMEGAGSHLRGYERRGHLREAELRLNAMLAAPRYTGAPAAAPPVDSRPTIVLGDDGPPLRPGTVVALVGPSGSGKTTLIEQLLCLREVQPGRIHLDGADLRTLDPHAVRRHFAIAPQNAPLLAGTVRDNLLLANPGASEADLWNALHDAALDDRIGRMRRGLDTWIGENGASLSGGEGRRLAVARALLRDASWLLLDEPTEGLDRVTEATLMRRLRARMTARSQGAIIISHHAAVLDSCDAILPVPGVPGRAKSLAERRPSEPPVS